jgi:nitronate monooxygenase
MAGAPLAACPAQNALTREIRALAAKQEDSSLLSLRAGQAAALARELPARERVAQILQEAQDVIARLSPEP